MSDEDQTPYVPAKARLDIASLLTDLVALYDQLAEEIYEHSNDREMPGGDALHYHGPVADPPTWERRYDLSDEETQDWMIANSVKAERHPLMILATAEDDIRAMLDQPTDLRTNVHRAADYIRRHLDEITPAGAWLPVESFIRDLKKSIRTLENVLKTGTRPDRGAPCLKCGELLCRVWAGPDFPVPGKKYDLKTEYDDKWRCGACGEVSTHAQYLNAVRADYLKHAEWLTADDMAAQWHIPIGTLQSWASRGHVEKRRDQNRNRMTYNVADAKAQRDTAEAERMGA